MTTPPRCAGCGVSLVHRDNVTLTPAGEVHRCDDCQATEDAAQRWLASHGLSKTPPRWPPPDTGCWGQWR